MACRRNALDEHLCRPFAVDAGGVERCRIAERRAIDPFGGEHAARRPRPVDLRHAEVGIAFDVLAHLGDGGGFHAQVHFEPHRPGERLHGFHGPQPLGWLVPALDEPRREEEALEIGIEPSLDAGPQDLDRHLATIRGPALVDLRDRRGGDWRTDMREQARRRSAEGVLDLGQCKRGREGRQAILQARELLRLPGADQVGPRGEELPELDVARTQGRERRHHVAVCRLPSAGAKKRHKRARATRQLRQLAVVEEPPVGGDGARCLEKRQAMRDGARHISRAARPHGWRRCRP